jgi:putative copper resistance protein D
VVPPLSVRSALLSVAPDPLLLVAVAGGAGLYWLGVRRLAQRGRRWPRGRTACAAAGLLLIAAVSQLGYARYDTVLFSAHMVQHIGLGMAAPLLLALSAPVTLALQAAPARTQRGLLAILHGGVLTRLTHPLAAWTIFAVTPFVLYFTPLFNLSLRNDVVHALVHLHLLGAGILFFWPAIGTDPSRVRLHPGMRALYLLVAVPFHAFLAVAILGASRPLGGGFYEDVARTWGASPLSDQRTGAGLLWASGDLLALVAGGIAVWRWMQADERAAGRADLRVTGSP